MAFVGMPYVAGSTILRMVSLNVLNFSEVFFLPAPSALFLSPFFHSSLFASSLPAFTSVAPETWNVLAIYLIKLQYGGGEIARESDYQRKYYHK